MPRRHKPYPWCAIAFGTCSALLSGLALATRAGDTYGEERRWAFCVLAGVALLFSLIAYVAVKEN